VAFVYHPKRERESMGLGTRPAIVLMGHDVWPVGRTVPETAYNAAIGIEALEAALLELRDQGYRFVALDEFMKHRQAGGVALLTFDDAYANVVYVALPVLQRLGVPALIFVVCNGLGAGDPFPHFLYELQDSWPRMKPLAGHPALAKVLASTSRKSLDELFEHDAVRVYDMFAQALSADELATLSADLAAAGMPRRTMNRDQLERAARSELIELGAHSMTHRPLTTLPAEEVDSEIKESARTIAGMTGKEPADVAFAYPYGFVSAHAASVVGRSCRSGFTCAARPVSALDRGATLPRINLDRSAPRRAAEGRPLKSATAALRETALLYARTDLGRRATAPLRYAARALRGR